jgi:hypothetical protein
MRVRDDGAPVALPRDPRQSRTTIDAATAVGAVLRRIFAIDVLAYPCGGRLPFNATRIPSSSSAS